MEKGYQLHRGESLADSLRRISARQTVRAAELLRDETLPMEERVHNARKRIKETRALLRLFRGALGDAFDDLNRRFRDAGRELAPYRDATAVAGAIKTLSPSARAAVGRKTMHDLRSFAIERQRAQFASESAIRARFESLIARLVEADDRLAQAPMSAKESFSMIEDGIVRTVSAGRRAMDRAYSSGKDAHFHEWRKRVKDHEHHIELLNNVWPKVMTAIEKEIGTLADKLGHHHDLALVTEALHQSEGVLGSAGDVQRVGRLLAARQKRAVTSIRPIAERVYAIRPRHIGREIGALWETWRA